KKLVGGLGIMLDDVFAGLYALAAVQILNGGLQQFIP
ncbi:MAG: phosphatidylglycerophosphatase A, partial [Gammaproteobacteria bacterium]|nr:phosphatidylglycerophosphatase A [Gammaproteobacteria bacterium]